MTDLGFAHEQINAAGKGILGVVADAPTDPAAFQAELAGHGQPWGKTLNDPIGPLIGTICMALACYTDNIKPLHGHGTAIQATAANYRDSEDASTSAVNQIHSL